MSYLVHYDRSAGKKGCSKIGLNPCSNLSGWGVELYYQEEYFSSYR
jgi:hypothetical protein